MNPHILLYPMRTLTIGTRLRRIWTHHVEESGRVKDCEVKLLQRRLPRTSMRRPLREAEAVWRYFHLTLNAPIATTVVCFFRLLKCLRSLCGKHFAKYEPSTLYFKEECTTSNADRLKVFWPLPLLFVWHKMLIL